MRTPFQFSGLCPIGYGENRVNDLGNDVTQLAGEHCPVVLISDKGLERAGLVNRMIQVLEKSGHPVTSFVEVKSDPLASSVDEAAQCIRALDKPCVIGLGGGSPLDVTKLAASVCAAEESAAHYAMGAAQLPKSPMKKIFIPTTAGTGSEVTRTCIYTLENGRKVWAWGDELKADFVILDPSLTTGLPKQLTAATGLDAVVHAIEASTAIRRNPMSDSYAYESIRIANRYLKKAVDEPNDLEARGAMLLSSMFAGIAIDYCGTGVAHSIGHALAVLGGIHHGRAVAIGLKAAMAWNIEAAPERYAPVAEALGAGWQAEACAKAYARLVAESGLDLDLSSSGVKVHALAKTMLLEENMPMIANNAREIQPQDVHQIAQWTLEQG